MKNSISRMESPILGVHADRCLLVRNRNGECLKCAEVCTTGAISKAETGIAVDPDLCIGCGTCASACPACCLEATHPTDAELSSRIARIIEGGNRTVAFICQTALEHAGVSVPQEETSCAPIATFDDGTQAIPVVCLGRIEESAIIESIARGAKLVVLMHSECETCPHSNGGTLSCMTAKSATELLRAFGSKAKINRTDNVPPKIKLMLPALKSPQASNDLENRPSDKNTSGSSESENQLKANMYLSTRTAIRRKDWNDGTAEFVHVQADGTLPHFLPDRRKRLFNSLKRIGTPQQSTVTTRIWGQINIDTDLCRSCRMCTVFCPTGAISRFNDADGTFGVYHQSSLCVQCRECEAICPERAITVSNAVELKRFMTGERERIQMKPVDWHPSQEDAIATRMARFIKTDALQDPQAKIKPSEFAKNRKYALERQRIREEKRIESEG